jgi:D-alanyl-D-alanine carboxypeptidase
VVALGSKAKFAAILDGLAIAGESGTLGGRLVGTDLVGRLRAKTGHIDGVVGLAGVIDRASPATKPQVNAPEVRFAFLANGGFSTTVGETMQDDVAEAIGTFVDAPAAPDPVPAPR